MKSTILFFALLLAGSIFLAGCSKDDSIVDPLNQPPAGVTNEQSSINYMALADEFSANTEATMDDGDLQPAEYGLVGKVAADLTPLRFGRIIRSITRNVEIHYETGDSVAEAMVTKDILGVFKVRGINGEGDTVTVEKEFHDRSMKRVIFRRVSRDPVRYWRNWIPVGTSLVAGGTVEPNDNIAIQKVEVFLPNGDTIVVTDPLEHMMRYRWARMLNGGMLDSLHPDRPPVPELLAGQRLSMRVTIVSAYADTDLVALRFGCNPVLKRRALMELVAQEQNEDGTFTRVYERMWTVPAAKGFFHAAVDAVTRGTIFDDVEPYSVSWWGVPYRVF